LVLGLVALPLLGLTVMLALEHFGSREPRPVKFAELAQAGQGWVRLEDGWIDTGRPAKVSVALRRENQRFNEGERTYYPIRASRDDQSPVIAFVLSGGPSSPPIEGLLRIHQGIPQDLREALANNGSPTAPDFKLLDREWKPASLSTVLQLGAITLVLLGMMAYTFVRR
jgi:hypothetical protein